MAKLNEDLNPSSSEFSKLSKLSQKQLGKQQAHGNPDEKDFENIERIVKVFDKAHPGLIKTMFNDVCTELALSGIDKHGILNKGSDFKRAFWLPNDLQFWMEKAYPSFWQEPRHAKWFCRKFPQFSYEHAASRVKTR